MAKKLEEKQQVVKMPLVGTMNQRGIDGVTNLVTLEKDQRFIGVFFNIIDNQVTNTRTIYAEKRPGFQQGAVIEAGSLGQAISADHLVTIFNNNGTYTVYYNDFINCGTITSDVPVWIRRVNIGNQFYYMISGNSPGGFGYFVPEEATGVSTSYTGDTHTNTIIDGILPNTTGMYVGQIITGTDIPAGTRIATITSSTAITITQAATGTTNDLALTRTHLAKIIDADFPTMAVGPFVDLDGYLFIVDSNGNIWNSDLNSVINWNSLSFLRAQIRPDVGIGLFKQLNRIGYLGNLHLEFFTNPGTQTVGSVLQATKEYYEVGSGGLLLGNNNLLAESGDALDAENDDNLILDNTPSIASFDFIGDDVFFYGLVGNQPGIWTLRAGQLRKLSGPSQDYIFASAGNLISIEAFAVPSGTFLHVRSGNSFSLLYHVDSGIWGESAFPSGFILSHDGHAISSSTTSGIRYFFNFDSDARFDDFGTNYDVIVQTARHDYESGNRKFVNYYELDQDRGKTGSNSINLEVSDDDGVSWSTVGTFAANQDHPRIYNAGSFVGGRQERITITGNDPWRAAFLNVKITLGDN